MKAVRLVMVLCLCGVAQAALLLLFGFTAVMAQDTIAVGINTYWINDYGRVHEFVDAMKHAREFGPAGEPWVGDAPIDDNGWPTGDAGTVVLYENPDQDVSGTYKLSFAGQATVTPTCCTGDGNNWHMENQVYDSQTNTTTADLVVLPGNAPKFVSFTNTNGGIQNIRLIRPGYDPNTEQVFTTPFLEALEPFSILRLMDFLNTNDMSPAYTVEYDWDERRPRDWATQATDGDGPLPGVAWEYVAELANVTGKDIWVNIPVAASDNYATGLAHLLDTMVDPDITVYVEYSNELWNFSGGFDQFHYNQDAAEAEVAAGGSNLNYDGETDVWNWGRRRDAKRTVEFSDIFRSVFGDAAMNTRVRFVLAWQMEPVWHNYMLRYIADNYGPPSHYLYAVAQAPYMENSLYATTVDQCLDTMRSHSDNVSRPTNMRLVATAIYWGLKSYTYEGGVGLSGTGGDAVKIAANYDPRIKDLIIHDIRDNWYAQGGDQYVYYSLCTSWDGSGCWGLTQAIEDLTTPKYEAMTELTGMARPPITAGTALPAVGQSVTVPVADDVWGVTDNATYYVDTGRELWFLFRSEGNAECDVLVEYVDGSFVGTLTYDVSVNGALQGTVAAQGGSSQSTTLPVTLIPGLNVVSVRPTVGHLFAALTLRTQSVAAKPLPRASVQVTAALTKSGRCSYHLTLPAAAEYQVMVTDLSGRSVKRFRVSGAEARFSLGMVSRGVYGVTVTSREQRHVFTIVR